MAQRGHAKPDEYVVSQIPGLNFTFSVWKDGMEEPYTTCLQPRQCSCPDFMIRRRHTGTKCKHHILVEEKLQRGGIF